MPRKIHYLRKSGRRGFLRKLSALGIGGTVLASITPETLAQQTNDPSKEVPRLLGYRRNPEKRKEAIQNNTKPPEPEPVFYTIPYDEWVYREGTINAADRLSNRLSKKYPSDVIYAVVGHKLNGGNKQRRIEVVLKTVRHPDNPSKILNKPSVTVEEVKETVPHTIDGVIRDGKKNEVDRVEDIEVVVVEDNEYDLTSSFPCDTVGCGTNLGPFFNHNYSNPPGGCEISIDRGQSTAVCTSATPAWDGNNNRYVLLTAGHCTVDENFDNDMSDGVGRTVSQNGGIGEVEEAIWFHWDSNYDYAWDAALVDLDDPLGVTSNLAGNSGDNDYDFPIVGSLSRNALNDYQEDGTELCRQGRTTGRCGGTVEQVNSALVSTDIISDGGDSGGPLMWLDEGNDPAQAYIAGILYGGGDFCPIENVLSEWSLSI